MDIPRVVYNCIIFVSSVMCNISSYRHCTGDPDEILCFGPTKDYCYYGYQRCDGIDDCPKSDLADECMCDMYCETKPNMKYCPLTKMCMEKGKPCPEGEVPIPDTDCPFETPYPCWRVARQQSLTIHERTCYSNDERCDDIINCVNGEDERSCDSVDATNTLIVFVIAPCGAAILLTICLCLIFRRWRRMRMRNSQRTHTTVDDIIDIELRLRFSVNSNRHVSPINNRGGNPVYDLPPPYSPAEIVLGPVIGVPPPLYLPEQIPSNQGPSSVLPTYTEATSDNEDNSLPPISEPQSRPMNENKSKNSPIQSLEEVNSDNCTDLGNTGNTSNAEEHIVTDTQL